MAHDHRTFNKERIFISESFRDSPYKTNPFANEPPLLVMEGDGGGRGRVRGSNFLLVMLLIGNLSGRW